GAQVTATAAVISDVPPGEVVSGFPARPHAAFKRAHGYTYRLRDLFKRVKELEKTLGDLRETEGDDGEGSA
ncbi:MAG: UDP-3-O-(3-hydroxymyristoyl)glucosamine N-acyltransferase, partial [Gemmatimonadetes bacterium]|nr:UDP-3-O-(3-hydroxymyristoyl)glucosamine N-acyltransferase [Gemmatimonadota bacterium]